MAEFLLLLCSRLPFPPQLWPQCWLRVQANPGLIEALHVRFAARCAVSQGEVWLALLHLQLLMQRFYSRVRITLSLQLPALGCKSTVHLPL